MTHINKNSNTKLEKILDSQNLTDWELQVLSKAKENPNKILSDELTSLLPECIEAVACIYSEGVHNTRIAYKRTDGFYEYKFVVFSGKFLSTPWHTLERPTDRQGAKVLESLGWIDPQKAFDQVWEQVKGKRERFILPDSGKNKTPFIELHYWNWLTENEPNGDHNSVTTKNRYLNSLGYSLYKHYLDSDDISILRHTLSHHWNVKFKR